MASTNLTKAELEKNISELPETYTSDQIQDMYDHLVSDMVRLSKVPGMDQKKMEFTLQSKHKAFVFSYPGIFFKTVKNELRPAMLKKMLSLKKQLDNNQIELSDARNRIVDSAKAEIQSIPAGERKKRVPKKGEVVQEINVQCKPDEI
jgi:hypothetical protein